MNKATDIRFKGKSEQEIRLDEARHIRTLVGCSTNLNRRVKDLEDTVEQTKPQADKCPPHEFKKTGYDSSDKFNIEDYKCIHCDFNWMKQKFGQEDKFDIATEIVHQISKRRSRQGG